MRRAVVDQSGLKVIFFGLLIAGFLGLIFRSQITNQKVNAYVETVFQDLEKKNEHKKLDITFSDARLALSDWGFPFPHLIVNNIKISSAVSECADNQIYIQSLDVPISWAYLLRFKKRIDSARASTIEFRLNNPESCWGLKKYTTEAETPTTGNISRSATSAKVKESLDNEPYQEFSFFIEKLKIIDKHNYQVPVLLQTVGAKVIAHQNELAALEIRAQLYLFKDLEQSIYKLKSDFNLNYGLIENNTQSTLTLKGKLIDKPFEMSFDLDQARRKILISHKMTDLSLKTLLSLFSREVSAESLQKQFEGISGLAVTSQGSGEFNLNSKALDFYKIDNFTLSSGASSAAASPIQIKSLRPFIFSPFEIHIQQFDLEKLKNISALMPVQKSVNDFGQISGLIKVNSATDFEAEGLIKGVQLIFSNQGQRANQKIDEFRYKLNPQKMIFDQIVLEGQKVDGTILMDGIKNPSQFKIKAEASHVKLNEGVLAIFSFNQSQSTLIDFTLDGDSRQIRSKIKFDHLTSDALDVKQAEVNYWAQLSAERKVLNPSYEVLIKNLKIQPSENIDTSFYQVLNQVEVLPEDGSENSNHIFIFDQIQAQHKSIKDDEFEFQINANYVKEPKGEKYNLHVKSIFKNPNQALFKVEVANRGKNLKKFDFIADLSRFVFEVKK